MPDDKVDSSKEEPKENSNSSKYTIDISKIEDSPEKARESTRSKIAQFYVYAFFSTIAAVFIIGLIKCFKVNDYKDLLIAVSGILSGPLGFIIGYYFKSVKE